MKVKLEEIKPSANSSFRLLLTPMLNDLFYWHFHPEYEIVYVEAERGTRHIGNHVSIYHESDLVFIGPHIPHLNFDYGVYTKCEQVVLQMKDDFLGKDFLQRPELKEVDKLFEKAKGGIAFYGRTKEMAGEMLKKIPGLKNFEQLILLLQLFQLLATSKETSLLKAEPLSSVVMQKNKERMQQVLQYVEENYQAKIDVKKAAFLTHLSVPAFCRYFKQATKLTLTEFANQFRINQSKKLLIQGSSVTTACYDCGFESLSYFIKTFKKLTGENPNSFKKRFSAKAA